MEFKKKKKKGQVAGVVLAVVGIIVGIILLVGVALPVVTDTDENGFPFSVN